MTPPNGRIFFKKDGQDCIAMSIGSEVSEVKVGDRFRCMKKWDKVDFLEDVFSVREGHVLFVYL
jgi:hypothetical protein